jgi:hypothetical protein
MTSYLTLSMRVSSLLFCLMIAFNTKAQYIIKTKLGVNLTRVRIPDPDNWPYYADLQVLKIGLQAGAGIEYNLNSFFTAEADLLYTQKGLKDTTHMQYFRVNGEKGFAYNFHYIELPVLVHFKVDDHLKLGAGASVSYLFKTQYYLDGKKRKNSSINYSNFDFGLVAEASWTIKRFEAGARLTHGISNVKFKSKYFDPELASESKGTIGKNRAFQFYLNYLIKKK